MKKFKLFFYPIYLITTIVVLYFSLDIILNMDAYVDKLDFATLRKLPNYALAGFIFTSILMLMEIVAENLQINNLKKKVKDANEEVVSLKAKLYDQGQQSITPTSPVLEVPESFDIPAEEQEEDEDDELN